MIVLIVLGVLCLVFLGISVVASILHQRLEFDFGGIMIGAGLIGAFAGMFFILLFMFYIASDNQVRIYNQKNDTKYTTDDYFYSEKIFKGED